MERLFDFLIEFIEDLIPWIAVEPEDEVVLVRNLPFLWVLYHFFGEEGQTEGPLYAGWGNQVFLLTMMSRSGQKVIALKPGFYWKLPYLWGLGDNTSSDNVKKQTAYLPEQYVRSLDGTIWCLSPTIRYSIRDIVKAVVEVQDRDDSFVADAAAIIAEWINDQHDADITIADIIANCQTAVKRCGTSWGCEVSSLGIRSLAPSRVYRVITDGGIE